MPTSLAISRRFRLSFRVDKIYMGISCTGKQTVSHTRFNRKNGKQSTKRNDSHNGSLLGSNAVIKMLGSAGSSETTMV